MIVDVGPTIRFATPDLRAQASMPFTGLMLGRPVVLDHVVRVEPSRDALLAAVDHLVDRGGEVVEEPHRFPHDVCPTEVADPAWDKWMATVTVDDGLLVVAAPLVEGAGQLAEHLAHRGTAVPHHVAVLVDDIEGELPRWRQHGWVPGPTVDDGRLGQVFLGGPAGDLVELIVRHDAGRATFTCGNVLALSEAEDELRGQDR